jgi:hypothetical protein
MLMTHDSMTSEAVHADGGWPFVEQCLTDPIVLQPGNVPAAGGDAHASAVSAGRGDHRRAGHAGAEDDAPYTWSARDDCIVS